MARMARVVIPKFPHHVTQRGNIRQKTFFKDSDYSYYLELMSKYSKAVNTQIWAYYLVPNHVHRVMVPAQKDGLRATLGEAHRRYTRHINFRHGWRGHLWQERFHSFMMDEDYLLATVRYMENNPVTARLCEKATQWRWSSARAHIMKQDDTLVTVKPMLERVNDWASYLSDSRSNRENQALIQQHTRTGRSLGSKEFISKIELLTGKVLSRRKPGPTPGGN